MPKEEEVEDFEQELTKLLNATCQENASNTPDFILATYLLKCLAAFNNAVEQRETWYRAQRGAHTTWGASTKSEDHGLSSL
jgi:hypothetical protein